MTDEKIETALVAGTQNTGNPILDSTVNLALEMIRAGIIGETSTLTEFCEVVYPTLKGLQ